MQSITYGSLVVVLDTFEELERNRLPDQGEELYGLFAGLASELPAFRLIVSGRGPAFPFLDPSRLPPIGSCTSCRSRTMPLWRCCASSSTAEAEQASRSPRP